MMKQDESLPRMPTIVIPRGVTIDQAFRLWSNVLRIWRLCGRASCRRSHACRGKARTCFRLNYPLLAAGVRDWFEAIGEAQREGMSYDDTMAELDGSDEDEAFRAWRSAVDAPLLRRVYK
jgi:hypothetical protein